MKFQTEVKRPIYFVFKFGDQSGEIEWTQGDLRWVKKVMEGDQQWVKEVKVDRTDDKGGMMDERVIEGVLGLERGKTGCILVRPDGHIIAKGYIS